MVIIIINKSDVHTESYLTVGHDREREKNNNNNNNNTSRLTKRKLSKKFNKSRTILSLNNQVIRRNTSHLSTWFVRQLSPGLTHYHRALPAAGIPVG